MKIYKLTIFKTSSNRISIKTNELNSRGIWSGDLVATTKCLPSNGGLFDSFLSDYSSTIREMYFTTREKAQSEVHNICEVLNKLLGGLPNIDFRIDEIEVIE